MQIQVSTLKALLRWVLLGWVFRLILLFPRLVLGFQLWVEAHQAESALRWKSVVPTSLFSKNYVKPIKSMELPHVGIFGCKEDGCSSFHPTSNTQIKRVWLLLSHCKLTSFSPTRSGWFWVFFFLHLSCIAAWCVAALCAPLLGNISLEMYIRPAGFQS